MEKIKKGKEYKREHKPERRIQPKNNSIFCKFVRSTFKFKIHTRVKSQYIKKIINVIRFLFLLKDEMVKIIDEKIII